MSFKEDKDLEPIVSNSKVEEAITKIIANGNETEDGYLEFNCYIPVEYFNTIKQALTTKISDSEAYKLNQQYKQLLDEIEIEKLGIDDGYGNWYPLKECEPPTEYNIIKQLKSLGGK